MFGVDYRLAPEHQYPLPLDDCSEALDWVYQKPDRVPDQTLILIQVIRNAAEYHVDVTRIGLLGGSAGGNLAAALALRYSQAPATTAHPVLRMVSLVVPATAHPKAESRFKKERQIPKSENELAFANEPPTPEAMIEKFETLLRKCLVPNLSSSLILQSQKCIWEREEMFLILSSLHCWRSLTAGTLALTLQSPLVMC